MKLKLREAMKDMYLLEEDMPVSELASIMVQHHLTIEDLFVPSESKKSKLRMVKDRENGK